MKKLILTVIMITCCIMTTNAAKRIMVNTPEEFIEALGSNREIVICNDDGMLLTPTISEWAESGKLKVYDFTSRAVQTGVMCEFDTDGPMLVLSGIKNLTIMSNVKGDRRIVEVTPRYVNVFSFINCEDIHLSDLSLGHTEEGYCSNGVLGFDGCTNVTIDNCGLFGCGTEGIELRKTTNFSMNESEIYKCSYHIMHLFDSSDVTFTNCAFVGNREFEQVNVDAACKNVVFEHCTFADNQGLLFNFGNQQNVKLRRCTISHKGSVSNETLECDYDCNWCLTK